MATISGGLVRPLVWIGSITTRRDEGAYHLVAFQVIHGMEVVRPACGARAFALTGSYPASGEVPGQKCQRCIAIEAREGK